MVVALQRAGDYNKHDQTPPAAILWPDKERAWEGLLPRLRPLLPILTLGPYTPSQPDMRSGPSYWLRCAIAGTVEVAWPDEYADIATRIPILYLPGVSRADLRAVEDAPRLLQPLTELQYRGVFWSQKNARDWTPYAFLLSKDGGLGIEIAGDEATREALRQALAVVAAEPIERLLAEAPLSAAFFDGLLSPDPNRDLLAWLNDPPGFRATRSAEAWSAFRGQVKRSYGVDPETDGPLTAATALGKRQGKWSDVWSRYCEAPDRWPNVEHQLRAAGPVQRALFDAKLDEAWPQDNEIAEAMLRDALNDLANATPAVARARIQSLEGEHGVRRHWVWATLGKAPLAKSLAWLHTLASATERTLGGAQVTDIAAAYTDWGWTIDDAVLRALAAVPTTADNDAVTAAVRALYRPWLEDAATAFQEAHLTHPGNWQRATPIGAEPGTCLLFSDALRLDIGQRLTAELTQRDLTSVLDWRFTPLPGVTPTAKPAISPVADRLLGTAGFDTMPAIGGAKSTAGKLRDLLLADGYQVLRGSDTGDPHEDDARGNHVFRVEPGTTDCG